MEDFDPLDSIAVAAAALLSGDRETARTVLTEHAFECVYLTEAEECLAFDDDLVFLAVEALVAGTLEDVGAVSGGLEAVAAQLDDAFEARIVAVDLDGLAADLDDVRED